MDKLITNGLSLGLDQKLRNDLIDNFKKIQNGVDGQSDALNKQIKDMLGNVPLQGQNEVTQARIDAHGTAYFTLKTRLDVNQEIAETALAEERKLASSAISQSPKQIFATLDELKAKYPGGASGVYLTADTGHWYFWNDGWQDGGTYQAAIVPDITKLEDRVQLNQFNLDIINGQRLGGKDDNGIVHIYPVSDSAYTVMDGLKLEEIPGEVMVAPFPIFSEGQFILLTDSHDKVIENFSYKQLNELRDDPFNVSNRFFTIKNQKAYIFVRTLKAYYGFNKMYLGFADNTKTDIHFLNSIDTADYAPWLKKPDEPTLIYKRQYAQTSKRYNTDTGLPEFETYNGTNILYFDLSKHKSGTLTIPEPVLSPDHDGGFPVTQFFYRIGSDGKVAENVGYSTDTGHPKPRDYDNYLTVKNGEVTFDLSLIDAEQLIMIVPSNYSLDFYEKYADVFNLNEINPSVKLDSGSLDDADFNLPIMVPVTSGEDQYIYFDSLIKNKNIYNNEITAFSKNMIDDHAVINATANGTATITYNDSKKVSIPYKVAPKTISGDYKMLVIGESTSEADAYMTSVRDYLTDSGANFTLLGSRQTSINKVPMEAYSGWGAGTLRYVAKANNRKNEFYNPDTKMFDYDYYLKQHTDQAVPDICLINFGINPTNRYTDPAQTTTQSQNIQFIISQIRAKNRDCKFIVGLTHYAARWSNYWADRSARREEILQGVADLIDYFGNRENENIYLNPMFASLDPRWDMQYKEIKTNRNNEHTSYRGKDSHHPSSIGYKNNAYSTVQAVKYAILN